MSFKDMVAHFKGRHKGQGDLLNITYIIVAVGMLLVIAAVMFGKIQEINGSSLGNNANATKMIGLSFDMLFTSQGVILLVIVITLLALALGYFLGGFAGGRGKR